MKTLIFADVHLKVQSDGESVLGEFVDFLRAIDPAEFRRVIILGDLFDFWFEYRHVIFSGYFEVLRALADLRDAGVELHLVCGNHDFWAGRFLHGELGIEVHLDSFVLEENGCRAMFIHGDGLNAKDWRYRWYKRFARAPFVVWGFRLLHPDWAMGIAERASRTSRTLKEGHPENGREVSAIRDYAQGVVERGEADIVFSGHTHQPDEGEWDAPGGGSGRYINAGDWLKGRRYLVWDGETVSRAQYTAGNTSL